MRFILHFLLALMFSMAAMANKDQAMSSPANPATSQELKSLNAQRTELQNERNSLTGKQDFWHSWTIILGVIAALIGILAGAAAYVESTRSYAQRDVDDRLAAVDRQIDDWKTKEADGKISALAKEASDSKTKQQNVEIELDKQKEITAKAEMSLLELQKKLDWREISPAQRKQFLDSAIGKRKGIVKIIAVSSDAEAKAYAGKLKKMLKQAGWDSPPITTGVFMTPHDVGLQLIIEPKDAPTVVSGTTLSIPEDSPVAYGYDLLLALQNAGFVFARHGIQQSQIGQNDVTLTVGSKP